MAGKANTSPAPDNKPLACRWCKKPLPEGRFGLCDTCKEASKRDGEDTPRTLSGPEWHRVWRRNDLRNRGDLSPVPIRLSPPERVQELAEDLEEGDMLEKGARFLHLRQAVCDLLPELTWERVAGFLKGEAGILWVITFEGDMLEIPPVSGSPARPEGEGKIDTPSLSVVSSYQIEGPAPPQEDPAQLSLF